MMADGQSEQGLKAADGQWFEATHWSMVLAAGEESGGERQRRALETLCQSYWEPLYVFIRRQGYATHDAEDMAQAFFAHLLTGNRLQGVAPNKGKFRSYLLACLKHFMADQYDRRCAAKRGGGQIPVALNVDLAESRISGDEGNETAEQLFDRHWALTLLDRAFEQLEADFSKKGKERNFAELKRFLSAEGSADEYAAVAKRLDMTPKAAPVAVHRLRHRYREIIREQVAHTVEKADAVDQEMHYLLELLCRD